MQRASLEDPSDLESLGHLFLGLILGVHIGLILGGLEDVEDLERQAASAAA
tara:strand:+ start:42 stop:194 length:153 start_codon:yes stop_codon:yes gene_type:complete